jgi:hypothetical protein
VQIPFIACLSHLSIVPKPPAPPTQRAFSSPCSGLAAARGPRFHLGRFGARVVASAGSKPAQIRLEPGGGLCLSSPAKQWV